MSAIRRLLSRTVSTVSRSMSLCTAATSCGVRQVHNSFMRSMFCLDLAARTNWKYSRDIPPITLAAACRCKACLGVAGRPFRRLLRTVARQAERAAKLLRRPAHNRGRHLQAEAPGVLQRIGVLLEQIGTCPSYFLLRQSAAACPTRVVCSATALSDTVGLFCSPLSGAAGCVFHVLCRLFLLAWVCHLCSPLIAVDDLPQLLPEQRKHCGPFRAIRSFPATLDGSLGTTANRGYSATGFHLPQFGWLLARFPVNVRC